MVVIKSATSSLSNDNRHTSAYFILDGMGLLLRTTPVGTICFVLSPGLIVLSNGTEDFNDGHLLSLVSVKAPGAVSAPRSFAHSDWRDFHCYPFFRSQFSFCLMTNRRGDFCGWTFFVPDLVARGYFHSGLHTICSYSRVACWSIPTDHPVWTSIVASGDAIDVISCRRRRCM